MSLPNHGANPGQLAAAIGVKLPEHVVDFSENTNPFGPPRSSGIMTQDQLLPTIKSYPDPHVIDLTSCLAERNNIESTNILVGNGAAELIFLLAGVFRGKRVRIVEPVFSEYRDACEAYDCRVESFVLNEPWILEKDHIKRMVEDIDLLFLCSPSNPTGVRHDEELIIALLKEAEITSTYVVIDEAFYDFCVEKKGLHYLLSTNSNLIILRSMTKMYAIAGLRLGYVIANNRIITQLKKLQPPWSVNGLAQKIGLSLLKEESFVEQSIKDLHSERIRMKAALEQLDFDVSPSTVNFYLLSERNKQDLEQLFHFLAGEGVITRHTYNFKGLDGKYLRIAVKDQKSNDILLQALRKWRSS